MEGCVFRINITVIEKTYAILLANIETDIGL
jgi:hypothetical protein